MTSTHTLAKLPNKSRRRRAAMLVLIALCLPLCLIMAAFAVDVAWMQLVRTELRTSTDAAARAGAKGLSLFQDVTKARNAAKQVALRNSVAGAPMKLADADIQIGVTDRPTDTSRFTFAVGGTQPNAVRVTGKRTQGSAAGAVNLMFAGVLGVKTFQPVEVAASAQLDRDICLVLDRSGSMMQGISGKTESTKETDCNPPNAKSRWAALDVAVNGFLAELDKTIQGEAVGMVSYGSDLKACGRTYLKSTVDATLSTNYTPVRDAVKRIGSEPIQGRTNISAGLDDGVAVLTGKTSRRFAKKTLILMTDGLQNEGRPALQAAKDAAKKNIIVHTITFSDDADQKGMDAVAKAGGGKHFHAPDAAQLTAIFKEIANTLPVLTTE